MFVIRQFLDTDLEDVINLWDACDLSRPWNNPEVDIFRKLAQKDQLFLVAVKDNELIATLMGDMTAIGDGRITWLFILTINAME